MLPLVLRSNEISFLLQGRLCLLLQSVWKAGKCPFVILSISMSGLLYKRHLKYSLGSSRQLSLQPVHQCWHAYMVAPA